MRNRTPNYASANNAITQSNEGALGGSHVHERGGAIGPGLSEVADRCRSWLYGARRGPELRQAVTLGLLRSTDHRTSLFDLGEEHVPPGLVTMAVDLRPPLVRLTRLNRRARADSQQHVRSDR